MKRIVFLLSTVLLIQTAFAQARRELQITRKPLKISILNNLDKIPIYVSGNDFNIPAKTRTVLQTEIASAPAGNIFSPVKVQLDFGHMYMANTSEFTYSGISFGYGEDFQCALKPMDHPSLGWTIGLEKGKSYVLNFNLEDYSRGKGDFSLSITQKMSNKEAKTTFSYPADTELSHSVIIDCTAATSMETYFIDLRKKDPKLKWTFNSLVIKPM